MNREFPLSRRQALQSLACGIGGVALSTFLADTVHAAPGPHHTGKAKSLIFLNMQGGPTQFETFDYKPEMAKFAGKTPSTMSKDGVVRLTPGATILPPMFEYLRKGESGLATTSIFPHMAGVMDELCVIRSMVGDSPAHPSGQQQALTGYARAAMPSIGSWILYGLGSANKNLPGFVYLAEGTHHGSGFLPAETQGMGIGNRLPNLKRSNLQSESQQRELLDELAKLNGRFADQHPEDSALSARIEAGELAFRMQMSCPEAVDLSKESRATLELYGLGGKAKQPAARAGRALSTSPEDFGTMCLIARRLVQRGVRVVTIAVGGRRGWDQHGNLKESLEHNASVIDQGMDALRMRRTATDAITSRKVSPTGSRAAASKKERCTARPTKSVRRSSKTRSTSTTCTRRFCIRWDSITRN